jgi:outer membrane protein assembly factor BamB
MSIGFIVVSMLIASQFASAAFGNGTSGLASITSPVPAATPAQPGSSSWSVQEVLTGGSFGAICMVLDSNDNPRIVHAGKDGMMYYTLWDGSNWKTHGVIQGGTPNELVLDSGNNPHILYRGSNGVMYYASLKGSSWRYQVVPEGNRYSMVLDSQGKPHLAYGTQLLVSQYPQGVTNNYYALNYASWNGTGWTVQTVERQISSSDTISLSLDSHDTPRIMYGYDAYYPPSGGYTITVKLATWTGSRWDILTAPPNLDHIGSMVLDSRGYPHFVYEINYPHESGRNVSLGYASWNGATWSTQTIASNVNMLGLFIQYELALDSRDNPRVEFFNGSLMFASWTGLKWNLETAAPDQFAYGEGPLALDTHGSPNICYWVDDIRNTTAFVSMLIITTPNPLYRQGPLPRPTSPAPSAPLASAAQLWVHPSNWSIVNSPILADGLVYVSSGNSGTGTLGLLCLNASTGAEVWSHTGLFSTFTLTNGYIYIGEASYGPAYHLQGVVSCLNAFTGTQLWNFSVGTGFTTPEVSGGVVYVGGFDYAMSTDVNFGFIYALNASTGERLWVFQGPAGSSFGYQPLILEGSSLYALSVIYASHDAAWHSSIYAFNAQMGELLWNYTAVGQFGSILVDGQKVYVSSNAEDTRNNLDAVNSGGYVYQGGVLALNASNGVLLWRHPIESSVGVPIVVDNTVYAVSGDGVLYALDIFDGRTIWCYTAGTGLGLIQSVKGYLYVGSSTGVLCLNAFDGTIVWNFTASDFTGVSSSYQTYSDGVIYVGANGPMFFSSATHYNFYAISASTGETLWNYTLGYGVASTPAIENGTVYIGGDFVTRRSPDFECPGAIIALKPSITSLPLRFPSPTVPEFRSWIILPLAIVTALAALLGVKRKKLVSVVC